MYNVESQAKPVSAVFFRNLGGVSLLLASTWLWLVVGLRSYRQAQVLESIVYNDFGYYRLHLALEPARWWMLRGLLLVASLLGTALVVGKQSGTFLAQIRAVCRRAIERVQRLPRPALGIALALVFVLVASRIWYLVQYPLSTDEVGSYDFFVSQGPLAISCYYPIPNNHILYNLLAWPGFVLGLSPQWVMRLPTLLFGTAGTVVGYLLLTRVIGLRVATLVTGLVGLGPLWVYYGAVGRGYFLQFCLLQMAFFAALELMRSHSHHLQLAWMTFVACSVLALYTIPTYVYPLAALSITLACGLGKKKRLHELCWALLIIGVVSLLLYAPVGMVSGWKHLLNNRYVATRNAAQFWPPFRAVLYETAAELFGPSLRFSGPAWLGGSLLGGLAAFQLLPAGPRRQTALLAWTLLATPLLLMAAQRVYMPARTLLYLTFVGYLLLTVLLAYCGRQMTKQLNGLRWPLILAIILVTGGWRLYNNVPQLRYSQHETKLFVQAYQWLLDQPHQVARANRVWLRAPLHALFFAHYNQTTKGAHPMLFTSKENWPTNDFDFIVLSNRSPASTYSQSLAYSLVYHDELITVYAHR